MKKTFILCLVGFSFLFTSTVTLANTGWDISIHEWDQTGSFDYTLYYPHSSQVISKINLPQDQLMKVLNVKYTFTNKKNFIKLQYGGTEVGTKGRGSDSDWNIEGFNTLTDFGDLDVYGEQRLAAIHFGTVLIKNEVHKAAVFLGWIQQETTNELKNIVYHLVDGVDVGDLSQPDNGSRLDGENSGLLFGINEAIILRPNLILSAELNCSLLSAKAYGHWANHIPAWNWEDTGRTVGYGVDIGLKYAFNSNIQAELGYCYNFAKATGCSETLNGVLLSQLVDLEYERKGLHGGLVLLF